MDAYENSFQLNLCDFVFSVTKWSCVNFNQDLRSFLLEAADNRGSIMWSLIMLILE